MTEGATRRHAAQRLLEASLRYRKRAAPARSQAKDTGLPGARSRQRRFGRGGTELARGGRGGYRCWRRQGGAGSARGSYVFPRGSGGGGRFRGRHELSGAAARPLPPNPSAKVEIKQQIRRESGILATPPRRDDAGVGWGTEISPPPETMTGTRDGPGRLGK